jgi:hypothetical protein
MRFFIACPTCGAQILSLESVSGIPSLLECPRCYSEFRINESAPSPATESLFRNLTICRKGSISIRAAMCLLSVLSIHLLLVGWFIFLPDYFSLPPEVKIPSVSVSFLSPNPFSVPDVPRPPSAANYFAHFDAPADYFPEKAKNSSCDVRVSVRISRCKIGSITLLKSDCGEFQPDFYLATVNYLSQMECQHFKRNLVIVTVHFRENPEPTVAPHDHQRDIQLFPNVSLEPRDLGDLSVPEGGRAMCIR